MQKIARNFDWEKAFESFSVDRNVDPLHETLLKNFRNYIPNTKIKFNYCLYG